MYDKLSDKILTQIREYNMLQGVSVVTVALSGGADSMSLLYFFKTHESSLGITVEAAHLNHNLRGEESLRDENFVRQQCSALGVKLYVRSVDISKLSSLSKTGIEECGRAQRYGFFAELRRNTPRSVTATAHTASDNAETVLLNLTRGSGVSGLAGIPHVRDGVIRPLLGCTRSDVEDYCSSNNIKYITDSTNLSDEYSRNRIRLDVIPQLKMINPSAEAAINRLSALAASDSALIMRIARSERQRCSDGDGLSIKRLRECGDTLSSHIIRLELDERFGITPEKRHTEIIWEIISEGSGAVEVRKSIIVRAWGDRLLFENTAEKNEDKRTEFFETDFSPGISFEYNGRNYAISDKLEINGTINDKINKKLLINWLSCDIISGVTKIRCRRSGDVFAMYGRGCTKKVKKLFCEMRIPQDKRDKLLVVANGSRVLWIEGIGVSEDAALTENDKMCYEIRVGCEEFD